MTTPNNPSADTNQDLIEDEFLSAHPELDGTDPEARLGGLGLTPNEVVGYRINPDEHNWTVVLVRKYGPASKNAGQEYATPLGYFRTLQWAANWILNRDARMQTEMHGLKEAMTIAEANVKKTIEELERRLTSGEIKLPSSRAPILEKPKTESAE